MQKGLFLALLLLCFGYHNYGQDTLQIKTPQQEKIRTTPLPPPPPPPPPPRPEIEEIFIYREVEKMPYFPGCGYAEGEEAKRQCSREKLKEFIQKNLKYPEKARRNNISGEVQIQFVIEMNGSINSIEVLEGLGYGCDEEAMRVLGLMNKQGIKWSPWDSRGRAVRLLYKIPVHFKLMD